MEFAAAGRSMMYNGCQQAVGEPGMIDRLSVTLQSSLAEIPRLSEAIASFAARNELSVDALTAANLVLEEVVTNIIVHGLKGREGETIAVKLALEPEMLVLTSEDSAPPFNPLLAPEPDLTKPLDERRPGGLGIHLLRRMMDRLEYRRADGKNQLTMWKRLAQRETPAPTGAD